MSTPAKISDPDQIEGAGSLARLHRAAGRLAIRAAILARGRISLGVRLLAFDGDGGVFLVRHSYVPGLHLPGGGVEPNESCRDAVVREAREEGGLRFTRPPEQFRIYWNEALGGSDHVVLFVARGVERADPPPGSLEIVSSRFHAPDALPEDVTPAARNRISEVLHGARPSERW